MDGRVALIVARHLGVDPRRATREARLAEDLGADRAEMADLVRALELEFTVELSRDAGRIATVGDAARMVQAAMFRLAR